MANNFLQNGLLGMGGFGLGGNNMPANSLLGDFYDPAEARKYQMKQMLLGLGAGLMAEKGFGKGAALALAAGDRAGSQYRDNAMDAYRIKSQQDQQAKADARYEREWNYNVGRDKKADALAAKNEAWQQYLRDQAVQENQRADDLRQGQQDHVTGFMGDQTQQGASLPFSPGVRSIARQGGLAGPSALNQKRFDAAAPFVGANDYGSAFNQIAAQPESAGPNWKETTLEDGVYWVDQSDPSNRLKIGERPNRNEGEGRGFQQEKQLRSEYTTESKPYTDLRINYQKIQASSQDQTGASDIALVYSFMKMLDPTSVVREGEFATAENAGGVDGKVITLYNNLLNGQRLPPQVRKDFAQQAARQYEQQFNTYQQIRAKYAQLAKQYGLDPANVAPDVTYGVTAPNQPTSSPSVDDLVQQYSNPR